MIVLRCACVLLTVGLGHLAPSNKRMSENEAMEYLEHFGYMDQDDKTLRTPGARPEDRQRRALEEFQSMAGIPVTGELDEKTKRMMALPRCGNKDKERNGNNGQRPKRYVLQGGVWPYTTLTYRIQTFTPDMSRTQAATEIERAFKVWSDVTPLRFVRVNKNPDIEILFARRNHGDGSPFDGPGGTLAHAYFPRYGGDAHFDDDEQYTFNKSSGINLFQVAAHEFGHSLGLGHSEENDALMAPFYPGYIEDFKLHPDDIAGIQALYGKEQPPTAGPPTQRPVTPDATDRPVTEDPATAPPTQSPATPKVTDTPPSGGTTMNPDSCGITKIDAAVYSPIYGRTYMFTGDVYYRLNDYAVDSGFPRKISVWWPEFEGKLDAALSSYDPSEPGALYFFKGASYWKWIDGGFAEGYPKTIGVDGFYGVPANISAAYVWNGNKYGVYFIKGDQYYRLGNGYGVPYEERTVKKNYPRHLRDWTGMPADVSAAIQWKNGRNFFFSGVEYTRFNARKFKADRGYPKSTARWWFGCSQS